MAGFRGVNITFPFKERVIEYVDDMSNNSKIVGSGNTLIFKKQTIAEIQTIQVFSKLIIFILVIILLEQ